jgi:signal transduction histidine kinase
VAFVAIVTLLGSVVTGANDSHASLVATGLVAVTFDPMRQRVQRGVNHLLYGERDDPYKVVAELGDLLGQTLNPNDVLPLLTETIVRSMRVPYVAVELQERDRRQLFAECGEPTTSVQAFDMVTHGERVGRLLVATRTVGGRFTPRESRLLETVALHAAVAAEATRLIRDLEDSRSRLIVAQDKERARLWRDLHDGVGSALTGMAMQVRAARKCVRDPARVGEILDGLADDLRDCRSELRQLVDHLQPHALDRGLAAALRAECRRFSSSTLSVDLDIADDLDGLPVATQVAAYRIVAEALHNVARHAQARTCRVTVGRRRSLTVDIVDDGVGIKAPRQGGVGLNSMRERASELGGDCCVVPAGAGGTAVRVRLPIAPMRKPSTD